MKPPVWHVRTLFRIKSVLLLRTLLFLIFAFSFVSFYQGNYAQTNTANCLDDVKQAMIDNAVSRNTTFTIYYNGDVSELRSNLNRITRAVYNSDAYLGMSFKSLEPVSLTGTANYGQVTFEASYISTHDQELQTARKINEIVHSLIKPTMNDYDKVKTLHDYIMATVSYDYTYSKHSPYDALFSHSSVCGGYSALFSQMLTQAGIQNRIVTGNHGGAHAWNLIQISGKWYYDDPTNDDLKNNKYFLVSESVLKKNNFTWDRSHLPSASVSYRLPNPSATIDIGK